MKKIFAILISLLLAISLFACGSSSDGPEEAEKETIEEEEEASEAPEAAEDSNEDSAENSASILSNYEETIVDENDVLFEIKGIDPDGLWGYSATAYLENNTEKTLMFSMRDVSINGVMLDPFWAEEVAPGKKSNSTISWPDSNLQSSGIDEVTQIEFNLYIYDTEDYGLDPVVDSVYTIYPLGEENATVFRRETGEGDNVLFEKDECKMVITGYNPDDLFGFSLEAYIENNTDTTLMFSVEDSSVNGFMADPFWATSVAPGKAAFTSITWMSSSLEENNIEAVETIDMNIHVYNYDDWLGDYIVDETFTIDF